MSRRRSTIHDAAALRLHSNGVRVPALSNDVRNPQSSVVTAKSKNPTLVRSDVRGNWTATDAGGKGRVMKRRKVNDLKEDRANREHEESGAVDAEIQDDTVPVKVFKDTRANRRVTFENDFTFLSEPASMSQGSEGVLPQPSSDFLKCIHYFASQYYASTNQLFDIAALYRKERKEKQRQLRMSETEDIENSGDDDASDAVDADDGPEEGCSNIKSKNHKGKGKAKAKAKVARKQVTQRDMYKAFEGSALLCIGMLLQSHVSSALADPQGQMPDGWDSEAVDDSLDPVTPRRKQAKGGKGKTGGSKKGKEKERVFGDEDRPDG